MKNKKTTVVVSTLGIFGIILITVGITYAFFSYSRAGSKENIVTSGGVTFTYDEGTKNGIILEDALPMPDSYGKQLTKMFDFKITSTSGKGKIPYEITLMKNSGSDNLDEYVKVYLTKVSGIEEEQKVLSMYNNLNNSSNPIASANNEKTLYKDTIPAGAKNYIDNYRLRIWLNDNINDGSVLSYDPIVTERCSDTQYLTQSDCEMAHEQWLTVETPATAKTFSLRVNVYASGVTASEEEIATADSTNLKKISIDGMEAIKNEDSSLDYDYLLEVPYGTSSINVVAATSNDNAVASIVEYNPTAVDAKIKRLSSGKSFNLLSSDNYYKITVTSANKQKIKDYILKVHVKDPSHDSTLKNLSISNCPLDAAFDPNVINYTCTTSDENVLATYAANDTKATVSSSGGNNLSLGENTVTIQVLAEDGTSTTYSVVVTREPENELRLSELTLGYPSDTNFYDSTKRKWTPNTYVKHLSGSSAHQNYYGGRDTGSIAITSNSIQFHEEAHYGMGFPMILPAGHTYRFSGSSNNCGFGYSVLFYKEDGTYFKYQLLSFNSTFIVPDDAYYTVFVIYQTQNALCVVNNPKIVEVL